MLTAEEAATRLGISMATLYAYVSRGLIRSFPDPDNPRAASPTHAPKKIERCLQVIDVPLIRQVGSRRSVPGGVHHDIGNVPLKSRAHVLGVMEIALDHSDLRRGR